MNTDMQKLVDVDQIAAQLDISRRTAHRLVKAGSIPFYRVGGQLRFSPSEVLDALRGEVRTA